MKITALLVLKCVPDGSSDPVILANATDVSHFGFFQRSSVKEFIVFVGRTVAKRTPPSQRQSVQHEEYKVHSYNKNGLCVVGFMDDHYPVRSAFSLLNKVIDEYQKAYGESWRNATGDKTDPWPYLNEALTKFQDPAEADKLLKIQRELDETKIILHKTIDSVLARGEILDSLVEKSSDLSAASQMFYKQAKKPTSAVPSCKACKLLTKKVVSVDCFQKQIGKIRRCLQCIYVIVTCLLVGQMFVEFCPHAFL